jgi:hypothetical protein
MYVVIAKEGDAFILVEQFREERRFEIKDCALVGYGMGMRYGSFVPGFGNQYTAAIRIKRMPEDVEQEIAFADKAYAEGYTILGFGGAAVFAQAFEVNHAVEVRFV